MMAGGASEANYISDSPMMSSPKSSINVCNDSALLMADLMFKTPSFSGVRAEAFLSRSMAEPGPRLTSMSPADSNSKAYNIPDGDLADLGLNGTEPGDISITQECSYEIYLMKRW